jgi:Zn-dependent protease with chaperone function
MEQNFKNHTRFVPGFHFILGTLIIVGLLGASIGIFHTLNASKLDLHNALLIIILFVAMALLFWYSRTFAIKAQDRAIRAEENLRYFSLTGKLFPAELKMGQIIALRFATNDEFLSLVDKAIAENLSSKEIKMAIKNWRGDYHRA